MSYPRQKDPNKCPEIVPTAGVRMSYHQCRGKVVKDGYCRLHHPDAVKERQAEAARKHEEKWANSPFMRLKAEQERCADLERRLTIARNALVLALHVGGTSDDTEEVRNKMEEALIQTALEQ